MRSGSECRRPFEAFLALASPRERVRGTITLASMAEIPLRNLELWLTLSGPVREGKERKKVVVPSPTLEIPSAARDDRPRRVGLAFSIAARIAIPL